jgi:hypothetical protein
MADRSEVAKSLSAHCLHGVHRDSSVFSSWVCQHKALFFQVGFVNGSVRAMGLLGKLPHRKELNCFLCATKDEK